MIKSMTGFGRCEVSEESRKITVEMKSVNHRYLDLGIKMPRKLNAFESDIRSLLKEYIQRGKVDVYITYEDLSGKDESLTYHPAVAAQYVEYFRQMEEQFGLPNDLTVSVLARCPEVLVMEEQQEDEQEIWHLLETAIRGASERFVEARLREGEALKADLLEKLEELTRLTAFVEERSPQIVAEYRQKLELRVGELLAESGFDEGRIAAEVTMYADKICVDEELVRLKSHIEATKAALETGGSVGRKLDFIAQELNREANTTLSKSSDVLLSDCAIDLKTGIEKLREQIQNIE
ncbi:MAG: YicC/YloC family endoribonuclease [Eubacteriales bacterium]|nr:YicC/YloC family endoribonuclease [Eubacteriales bacterium]